MERRLWVFGCGLYGTKSRLACMRGLQTRTVVGQVGAEGQVLPQLFYNADVQYLALMASVTSGCFGLEGTSKNQLVQAPLPWLASVSVSFFQAEFHYIAVVKRVHLMLTPCPAKLPFAVKQPALCEQGKLLTWCGCLPASGTDLFPSLGKEMCWEYKLSVLPSGTEIHSEHLSFPGGILLNNSLLQI